jgi:hypothetical protein
MGNFAIPVRLIFNNVKEATRMDGVVPLSYGRMA